MRDDAVIAPPARDSARLTFRGASGKERTEARKEERARRQGWRCYKTFTSPGGNCYGNLARPAPVNFDGTKINIHLPAARRARETKRGEGAYACVKT